MTPGAVTLFGLLNDTAHRVTFFIDDHLLAEDVVNAHPLSNDATTSISPGDVLKFAEATGHAVHVLKLAR